MTFSKKLLLTAAACGLLFGIGAAEAQPASPWFGGKSLYHSPDDPETFRLLSGMGIPAPEKNENIDWQARENAQKADLAQLFPRLSDQDYYALPYSGCRTDSPLEQLHQRKSRLGEAHPYIRQWLIAERAVMAMCKDAKTAAAVLPAPLATTDKAVALLQIQDRAYQQAAMLFYQKMLPEALAAFRAIAADKASADRPQAAFMVVAIQAGSRPGYGNSKPMVPPAETLKQVQAILADPSLKDVHVMAAGLIGWMGYNQGDPVTRDAQVREAITALMTPTARLEKDDEARSRYDAAVEDLKSLHGQFEDPNWILTGAVPEGYNASAALYQLAKTNPIAAWMAFPQDPYRSGNWAIISQSRQPDSVRAYLEKMVANKGQFDNPWVHINPDTNTGTLEQMVDAEIKRLKTREDAQAAAALSFDFYNLQRQLLMSGDKDNFADALQWSKDFFVLSGYFGAAHDGLVYLVAAGRLDEARQWRDALALDAPLAKNHYSSDVGALMVLAEDESHLVRAINLQPLYPRAYVNAHSIAELWRLADDSALNRGNRALFARAAWTREYALSRTIDWRHDQLMRLLNPEMTASWKSHPGRDVTPDDRLVLGDVLKSPALNMVIADFSRMPEAKRGEYENNGATSGLTGMDYSNHNDNNWWCGWEPARYAQDFDDTLAGDFRDGNPPRPYYDLVPLRKLLAPAIRQSFLFRNMDDKEHRALANVTCAPKFLADRSIAWVENTGLFSGRDGQAEALADAVAVTRWGGNRQGDHGAYSRHAYELLHTLFADSPAAKRTPYWFN